MIVYIEMWFHLKVGIVPLHYAKNKMNSCALIFIFIFVIYYKEGEIDVWTPAVISILNGKIKKSLRANRF